MSQYSPLSEAYRRQRASDAAVKDNPFSGPSNRRALAQRDVDEFLQSDEYKSMSSLAQARVREKIAAQGLQISI